MNTRLLVDSIVRQTTVFIAELCTAAGIRAPLAHIADEVFLGLARQLEEQGVGRKVAADMFGLALRGYLRKVQRLTESETQRNKTLWQAVIDLLHEEGSATRQRLFERFVDDSEEALAAILSDLVSSGLVYSAGRGPSTLYRPTSVDDQSRMHLQDLEDSVPAMLTLLVRREGPMTPRELAERLRLELDAVEAALDRAQRDGLATVDTVTGTVSAAQFLVPLGERKGWEAAVFDHFQSMVKAVSAKLRQGSVSDAADVIGGATLTFDIRRGHVLENEVLSLLREERARVNDLWNRVEKANAAEPVREEDKVVVTFYMGQNIEPRGDLARVEASGGKGLT
jgi:hypothetical protein